MRRGCVEGDCHTGLEFVLVEADAHAQAATEYVAVFLAAVTHERVLVARSRSRWIDKHQELDERIAPGRETLPLDAGLEVDRRAGTGRGDGPARSGRGGRLRAGRPTSLVREDVAHRHAERADERPECADGGVDLVALDLRDEAR